MCLEALTGLNTFAETHGNRVSASSLDVCICAVQINIWVGVPICAMKFEREAAAFECQTNRRGSQVVSVRPMGWAVCMVIM